jgi:site-specific DNA-methyltransferase (adenine-specific)
MLELNKVILGDCLEVMKDIPDKSIDMIFTDPVYRLISGGCKGKHHLSLNKYTAFSTKGTVFTNIKYELWISQLSRILKDDCYCFIMSNDLNIPEFIKVCKDFNLKLCQILVMKKQNKVMSLYFYKQVEFILMFRKGRYRKLNKYGISNLFEVTLNTGKNKLCPTEKPPEFIETIISTCSNEKEIILDCFAGSGSTGIAALNCNRKFILIEKDKKQFDIANKRIEDYKLQQKLF